MTRDEPRRATLVAPHATDCEAGASRPWMATDGPPGIGFTG
ncbi:hypothetical protein [Halococcus sediminicola]|nr:hypothetical protein [Halococcus sediminicola]